MREILFRGKRLDNDEWCFGSFITDAIEQRDRENNVEDLILADGFIKRYDFKARKSVMHEVDRHTVGQYTGKDDKNGVKIFEGDVVKFINELEAVNAPEIGVVVYEQSECCFEVQRKIKNPENVYVPESRAVVYIFDDERCTYEVIGNIHDNPELLEDAKK